MILLDTNILIWILKGDASTKLIQTYAKNHNLDIPDSLIEN